MLPRVLKNYNAYIDGESFFGRIVTAQLPELTLVEGEFRGGGMDAAVDFDMGMNKLDVQLEVGEWTPSIMSRFAAGGAQTQIVLRSALQRQGEAAVAGIVRMTGMFKQMSRGQHQTGQNSTMTLTANLNSYIEEIDGIQVVNIDVINGVRMIGGIDQLATIRAAIGV